MAKSLFKDSGTRFSADRMYRYELWRRWGEGPLLNFVMLNPSTADEVDNDQTVERCERRARQLGYDGLVVTNLFAFRATAPRAMKAAADPVGSENDAAILAVAGRAALVIAAWGAHGGFRGRSQQVRQLFCEIGLPLHCLALTQSGEPKHPLYLPYDLWPVPLDQPRE